MSSNDIEAIATLKYAYFRLLDLKEFEELGLLLKTDATAAYGDVADELRGRQAIVDFLTSSLSDPGIVTMHLGHHPELALTSSATASGTWYLHDRVIIPAADLEIGGTALYHDEYVKVDGSWLIAGTGYRRIFEEHRQHRSGTLVTFRSRFTDETAGSS